MIKGSTAGKLARDKVLEQVNNKNTREKIVRTLAEEKCCSKINKIIIEYTRGEYVNSIMKVLETAQIDKISDEDLRTILKYASPEVLDKIFFTTLSHEILMDNIGDTQKRLTPNNIVVQTKAREASGQAVIEALQVTGKANKLMMAIFDIKNNSNK